MGWLNPSLGNQNPYGNQTSLAQLGQAASQNSGGTMGGGGWGGMGGLMQRPTAGAPGYQWGGSGSMGGLMQQPTGPNAGVLARVAGNPFQSGPMLPGNWSMPNQNLMGYAQGNGGQPVMPGTIGALSPGVVSGTPGATPGISSTMAPADWLALTRGVVAGPR